MLPTKKIHTSFVFHADFIERLPEELTDEWMKYCVVYGLCGIQPKFKDPLHTELWNRIKDRIDADKSVYNQRIEYQKEYRERKKAEKENKKNVSNISNISNVSEVLKHSPIYESESVSDSVYESEYDSDSVSEYVSDADVCDKRKYFLELWNKNADVLGMGMTIERPKDFSKFFENETVTKEYIKSGIDNFVQAVKSGKLDKRFIPSTPDRFVLKNTLERFQKPYSADGKRNAVYDADHRGEFAEAERI